MLILAIQTSPNSDGLTATMAKEVIEGAELAGADTRLIELRSLDLHSCLACENGWGRCAREQKCIIEDDFELVRKQMGQAAGIVISTPVYFGEVSEITKNFFDRLRRCELGLRENSPLRGKPVIGISAAGGSGGGVVTALEQLERYFRVLAMQVFDLITVTQLSRGHKCLMAEQAGKALVRHICPPDPKLDPDE